MNSSPVEHAKCGSSNYTNDNNSDENKALRKQSLTTAELQDQCKKECDKRQDKALGILCGECPLYSNSGSYITDSCYYGTNYNRGEELADLTHNSGTAQQSLQCTADDDGAPNGRQTIGGSYAAHGGSERSRRSLHDGQTVANGGLDQCTDTHYQETCADHRGQNGSSIQTRQRDKHTAPYEGGKVYQSNLDGKVERFPPRLRYIFNTVGDLNVGFDFLIEYRLFRLIHSNLLFLSLQKIFDWFGSYFIVSLCSKDPPAKCIIPFILLSSQSGNWYKEEIILLHIYIVALIIAHLRRSNIFS